MIEQIHNPSASVRPAAARSATAEGKAYSRRPIVRRDDDAIVIDIPMTFRRRGKRTEVILLPDVAAAASPQPLSPLALAVARAFRW